MNKNKTNKNAEGSLLTQPTGSEFRSGYTRRDRIKWAIEDLKFVDKKKSKDLMKTLEKGDWSEDDILFEICRFATLSASPISQ
jgi:hypothetical protein